MNRPNQIAPELMQRLPPLAEAYLRTVNAGESDGYCKLFAQDATVDDNGRAIQGLGAVKAWADHDIFAANVRLELLDAADRDGVIVLVTKVDGDFDRTGLPDPVVIEHEIRTAGEKIAGLVCRLTNV
jgi:hypothetical protein